MKRTDLLVACILTLPCAARANNLVVDKNALGGACSVSRARLEVSAETPWCTLGPAGYLAEAGDTVTVREGTYDEVQSCALCNDNSVLQVIGSGRSDAWITYEASAGELVTLT